MYECPTFVCFCFSYGLTSVTTPLSPSDALLVRVSFLEIAQHAIFSPWIKCLPKGGIFCSDNFPGQTQSNNKHLLYSWSPLQEDVCQNCGCAKHFLRKGKGYSCGFDCIVCEMYQNHQTSAKLFLPPLSSCLPSNKKCEPLEGEWNWRLHHTILSFKFVTIKYFSNLTSMFTHSFL